MGRHVTSPGEQGKRHQQHHVKGGVGSQVKAVSDQRARAEKEEIAPTLSPSDASKPLSDDPDAAAVDPLPTDDATMKPDGEAARQRLRQAEVDKLQQGDRAKAAPVIAPVVHSHTTADPEGDVEQRRQRERAPVKEQQAPSPNGFFALVSFSSFPSFSVCRIRPRLSF